MENIQLSTSIPQAFTVWGGFDYEIAKYDKMSSRPELKVSLICYWYHGVRYCFVELQSFDTQADSQHYRSTMKTVSFAFFDRYLLKKSSTKAIRRLFACLTVVTGIQHTALMPNSLPAQSTKPLRFCEH